MSNKEGTREKDKENTHAGKTLETTDHKLIQQWVEERGGFPAQVKSTGDRENPGLLRIDFPGYSGKESLERISWDEFFKDFDDKNLMFIYQEKTRDGETSRFCKFVNR